MHIGFHLNIANVAIVDHLVKQVLTSEKYTDEHCISSKQMVHSIILTPIVAFYFIVASKKYFESQVRASKDVSVIEVKKKRMVSRRTKVSIYT